MIYDYIIVGGGISGLTMAYALQKEGHNVLLVEQNKSCGGVIISESNAFGNFELGPNSFAVDEKCKRLIEDLNLTSQIVEADQAAQKRYIFLNNQPTEINLKKLLFTREILSFKSKIKLLTERFKKSEIIPNETLADAIRRRFNDEILQKLVNPIISGIYAGNTEALEYKTSMKRLYDFEQEYGSFTKGFLKSSKKTGKRIVISFQKGIQQLTDALAQKLNHILYEEVLSVSRNNEVVTVKTTNKTLETKKIIFATPSYITARLINSIDNQIAKELEKIKYPSLLSLQFSFLKKDVPEHLDAFGILFPKQSKKSILGIINYNSVFKTHPNSEYYQYNVFLPITANPSEEEVSKRTAEAENDLKNLYNITAEPVYQSYKVWNKAIPQYEVGHGALLEKIATFEKENPSLKLIGNWKTGVAIGDCVHFVES